MILQLIIFISFLTGISYIQQKRMDIKKHRLFMGIAIILNFISIFLIMGRSFLGFFGIMVERYYEFTPLIFWIHGIIGGLAQMFGVIFLFKHPRKIILWMKVTATLWIAALALGTFFYTYTYL